jgi:hypothetical protein
VETPNVKGISTVNDDPEPSLEVTAIVPPRLSTSLRVIASPSPVPPKRRRIDQSAWTKL